MNGQAKSALVILLVLTGCSSHQGLFAPDCVAYAGETIQLQDGRFSWVQFTDEQVINDNGELVTSFPGFPKHGEYRAEDSRVYLQTDDGAAVVERRLHESGDNLYLLTIEQHDAVMQGGSMPECALRRTDQPIDAE